MGSELAGGDCLVVAQAGILARIAVLQTTCTLVQIRDVKHKFLAQGVLSRRKTPPCDYRADRSKGCLMKLEVVLVGRGWRVVRGSKHWSCPGCDSIKVEQWHTIVRNGTSSLLVHVRSRDINDKRARKTRLAYMRTAKTAVTGPRGGIVR